MRPPLVRMPLELEAAVDDIESDRDLCEEDAHSNVVFNEGYAATAAER